MKIISEAEFNSMNWRGRGSSSKVQRDVLNLEVGQILFIEKADWGDRKYSPSSIVRRIAIKHNRQFIFLAESYGKGWSVRRIK